MSSRIPPSQRDRNNLAAALRQTDRQVRSLSGPGYFGGRLGIPQPVPGSAHLDALLDDDDGDGTDADVDSPIWEDRDRYVLTAADVTRGYFRHQLLYREIVEKYEFTAYVNGVALDPAVYSLDAVNGIVIVTLEGWEQAQEAYRFQYAYTGDELEPEPGPPPGVVGFSSVGSTSNRALSGSRATEAWPTGTRASDLFVLGLIGASPNCADPRATQVGADVPIWDCACAVFTGPVTNPATPISFSVGSGGWGWTTMLMVIRPDSPIDFDTSRRVIGTNGSAPIPGLSGTGSGAVAIAFSAAGIGGSYGWHWPLPWETVDFEGSYFYIDAAIQRAETIGGTPALTSYQSKAFVLGLGLG